MHKHKAASNPSVRGKGADFSSCTVFRSYMEGSLIVDDQEPVNGTSVVGSRGLNIQGSILVGE